MRERQRKFLTNDEQMYAIGVHLSHVDVSGNARTAMVNTLQYAFAQTRSLLFGPTFVKCIRSFIEIIFLKLDSVNDTLPSKPKRLPTFCNAKIPHAKVRSAIYDRLSIVCL